MKIAVFHNLPSGGAKRALYNFVKYLTNKGHLVDVFIPSTADETFLPLNEVAHKVHIFPVKKTFIGSIYSTFQYTPPINSNISLYDLEKTEREIAYAINSEEYDVVFVEQDKYTMSPFLLKFLKKPAVYYCDQPLRNEAILKNYSQLIRKGLNNNLYKKIRDVYFNKKIKIDKENASFSRYIITNSYFTRESILRSYGLNSFVCYLGIDTEMFKPIEVSLKNFVLSVGRCAPAKGFDFIIKSLSYLDSKIRPKLIIVSDTIEKEWEKYLKSLANKLEVELEIKSLIPNDELVKLYNEAKLVVYAPYLEPFGLVPLEAMACGTPVVAVKEGGIRESVIHNETGFLTERDEEEFAQAVYELLLKDDLREKMGKRSIEIVQNFWTLEHAGKRLLKHLKRAIEVYKT